jgi:hypothetical protein
MEKIPIKTKDTAHRVLGDEAVVVNFKNSFFYNFNPVGTFIWERCNGHHNLKQIIAMVIDEYDVTHQEATQDCRDFIESLIEEGLLRWHES